MEGFALARFTTTRHSRVRGNPGWFSAQLAWIPAFADMTEAAVTNVFRVLHSTIGHPRTVF